MALLVALSVRRRLLACVALVVLSCGLLGLLLARPVSGVRLADARARWAGRSFSDYRLVVEEQTNTGRCGQDVRIRDEQIRQVFANDCVRLPSWTISNIFTWTEQLSEYKSRCYPSDITCVCFSIYTTEAVYNAPLGYPQSVTYRWELQPNFGYLNHWKRLWESGELPTCKNISRRDGDYITITVVSLTPLP
jgi:hypothetical protein